MRQILNKSITIIFFIIIVIGLIPAKPASAENRAMGMILEINGKAKIKQNNILSPANIMQPIYENSIIYTGKGSTLKFADYRDKKEYLIGDYSYIIFKYGKVEIKRGSLQKVSRGGKLPLPKNTVLVSRKISGVVYMYVVDPEVKISYPKDKALFATDNIEFTWNGDGVKEYEVIIIEVGTNRIMKPYPITVKDYKYKYSQSKDTPFRLEYGKSYFFVVRQKPDKELIEKYGKDGVYADQARITFSLLPVDQAKKVQEAEKAYSEVIKKNPDDKTSMLLMADMYKENGMYQNAVDVLYTLRDKDPENPYIYYYIAEMLDEMKLPGSDEIREKGKKLEKRL